MNQSQSKPTAWDEVRRAMSRVGAAYAAAGITRQGSTLVFKEGKPTYGAPCRLVWKNSSNGGESSAIGFDGSLGSTRAQAALSLNAIADTFELVKSSYFRDRAEVPDLNARQEAILQELAGTLDAAGLPTWTSDGKAVLRLFYALVGEERDDARASALSDALDAIAESAPSMDEDHRQAHNAYVAVLALLGPPQSPARNPVA